MSHYNDFRIWGYVQMVTQVAQRLGSLKFCVVDVINDFVLRKN